MTWQNLNPIFNALADRQGVAAGSWPWLQAGVAAYSGQAGAHGSYGWNHRHRIGDAWIRAVIANYGHRRTYYAGAPTRMFGYEAGGRPTGWTPESAGDQADGAWVQDGVRITGPEAEHFWLDPLWAVIDAPPIDIDTQFGPLPSNQVAHLMATYQVSSCIGQIRSTPSAVYPWGYGDRANARIIDTIIQGSRRGAIDPRDVHSAVDFIENVALPIYERAPGIGTTSRPPQRPGKVRVMTFNGLMWLLPVFYDAWRAWPEGETSDRLEAIVRRFSQWCLDLETVAPGKGFDIAGFFAPDDETFAKASAPAATLQGIVGEQDLHRDQLTWEHWGCRAAAVAAEVTGDDRLHKAVEGIVWRHKGSPNNQVWLVGADRRPLWTKEE